MSNFTPLIWEIFLKNTKFFSASLFLQSNLTFWMWLKGWSIHFGEQLLPVCYNLQLHRPSRRDKSEALLIYGLSAHCALHVWEKERKESRKRKGVSHCVFMVLLLSVDCMSSFKKGRHRRKKTPLRLGIAQIVGYPLPKLFLKLI